MGNLEILKRGEIQFTTAGTGISHSEYNRNKDKVVHFLQVSIHFSFSIDDLHENRFGYFQTNKGLNHPIKRAHSMKLIRGTIS
jgi:hypothetical protein